MPGRIQPAGSDLPAPALPVARPQISLAPVRRTFDNGGFEAPAIDVKYGGVTVASTKGIDYLFRTGDFVDVRIQLAPEGTVAVQVGGNDIYTNLVVGFAPAPGRFGLGARTGGLTDHHFVDDLTITTGFGLPAHPFVDSAAPREITARGDATVIINVRDGAETQLDRTSVSLIFNGTTVTPMVSKAGNLTSIQYDPPGLLVPGSANWVSLNFADTGRPPMASSFSLAFTVPNYIGPNGNFYEFVSAPAIRWEDAKAAAEQRTSCGRPGHLATITSAEEDVYLENLPAGICGGRSLRRRSVGGWFPASESTDAQRWLDVGQRGRAD
jgi:hypothetical protein